MLQLIAVRLCCFWWHKIPPLPQFKLVDFQQSCAQKMKNEYWLGNWIELGNWIKSLRSFLCRFRPDKDCPQCVYSCILLYLGRLPLFKFWIKFFIVNDSNHSTVCWSFPWIWRVSFLDVSLGYYYLEIFLERVLWIRLEIISYFTDNTIATYAKIIKFQYFLGKQFCVRKSSSSLSMNTMKVWTDLLNNQTRR